MSIVNFYRGFLASSLDEGGSETEIFLDRITNLNGETMETSDFDDFGRGVLTVQPDGDGVTKFPQNISFTGVSSANTSVTGAVRGLDKSGSADSDLKRFHPAGTPVIISFGTHQTQDLIDYLDSLVVSTRNIVVAGTAGETVAAGDLLYFDTTDDEWKKADASTSSTSENVMLGIAQGAGVDGGLIDTGILLRGLDENQTGMTAGDIMYISDTAGEISSSAGTKEVTVGIAKDTTDLYFSPRFNQMITEDEQDALVGSNGTPSNSNRYVTQTGVQRSQEVYAADSVGTDSYAITLSPAPTAYIAGMILNFKAGTANTGAATLDVNSLGAKNIKKHHDQDLEDGDIESGQVVTVVYDGTNFQMQSQIGRTPLYSVQTLFDYDKAPSDVDASTSEITIWSKSVGAGELGTGNVIRVKIDVTQYQTNGADQDVTLRLKYGSTTVATAVLASRSGGSVYTSSKGNGYIDAFLAADGATGAQTGRIAVQMSSQAEVGDMQDVGSNNITVYEQGRGTATEDSTGALTLSVTGQANNSGVDFFVDDAIAYLLVE